MLHHCSVPTWPVHGAIKTCAPHHEPLYKVQSVYEKVDQIHYITVFIDYVEISVSVEHHRRVSMSHQICCKYALSSTMMSCVGHVGGA